jgi:3D (Asp-Asp-Asp) domain-containing protein
MSKPTVILRRVLLALSVCLVNTPAYAASGLCGFDLASMSFAGSPQVQARCLLRPVLQYAHIGPERPLPPTLAGLVGNPFSLDRAALAGFLRASHGAGVPALVNGLEIPVSRARDNSPGSPAAGYFVIHDTSTPNLGVGGADFPTDIDSSDHVNTFSYYRTGVRSKAHFYVNRIGEIREFRDFRIPWRATKLEMDVVGTPSRGLFLHIELIQPRHDDRAGIDAFAPTPGFTTAQYERLATLYIVASTRAGRWLIPAYHTTLDHGLDDGHDDPQNFDLAQFDRILGAQLALMRPLAPVVATEVTPLRASLYYTALESDYPAGSDAVFRTRNGDEIHRASAEFVRLATIEGSAKLRDGRVLNVDGAVNGERRWMVIAQAYGFDALGCGLLPFRSAAVDRSRVALRTRLYLPETVGMRLPNGRLHDGLWYAVDTGSAIVGDRIDLFLGAGRATMEVPRRHGIEHLQELQAERRGTFQGCPTG